MSTANRIRGRSRKRNKRKASVLVIGSLFVTTACIMCALTVDVGNIYVSRAELQRSAESAALASVAVMWDRNDLNDEPNPGQIAYRARDVACEYVRLNPCRGVEEMTLPRNDSNAPDGDLVLGHYNSSNGQFDTSSTKYNSAQIFVRRDATQNGPIPLYFGGLIGMPSINAGAEAAAYIETDIRGFHIESGSDATCPMLPFSLAQSVWEDFMENGKDEYTHVSNNSVFRGPDETPEAVLYPSALGPGNFGTIDLGSPNNSTSDLRRQILEGLNDYDLSFFRDQILCTEGDQDLPLVVNGDTGISAAIQSDLRAIIGHPRILPLHSTMEGNGNNAMFTIVQFVGVTILDADLTGALRNKYVVIQPCLVCTPTAVGGGENGGTSRFIHTPPRLRKVR